jgi:hypothetical protein
MNFEFTYNKNKTIQGLRYHFFSRKEIKVLLILVNVFAIIAAILFYSKRIRPEPFLVGSCTWILLMISVWYVLPFTIYSKSTTFKEGQFAIYISEAGIKLDNGRGYVDWNWNMFTKDYFESPNFFHLYFDERSFFLIPKEAMTEEMKHEFRGILKNKLD